MFTPSRTPVFGVAPPQTLYHTRHSASPSVSLIRPPADRVAGFIPPASEAELFTIQRNPNRSSYVKSKKKQERPGTSESNKQLLPKGNGFSNFDERFADNMNHTLIYSHYQHSLNSLNDILDRDDRESLAELHQYLHGTEPTSPPVAYPGHRKLSNASVKPERRRSLPARTSMISLASELSVSPAKIDPSAFQMRRRRAAKLTQFFGVDYRELISDVLDSIENGVEQEQQRGTLRAEEVEDLLDRLRNLKTKRQSFI
ncbi:hypothetical protein CVT24_003095 [Panaeolus cyanescens]|uniref:Uncharacterized protein n=1 Tax=Panaeolus cyanescens TaxID=181874 RepID=A0A409W1T5_9AGAR|nr:hypothetical protein CVT24_003095 [Panaeolus cyanescens]